VSHTYVSKLEHDYDLPPSEKVIESLAHHLELDEFELKCLAYRFIAEDKKISKELLKKYKRMMSVLHRYMWNNPDFALKVFGEVMENLNGGGD